MQLLNIEPVKFFLCGLGAAYVVYKVGQWWIEWQLHRERVRRASARIS